MLFTLTDAFDGTRHDVHAADEAARDAFAIAAGWSRMPELALRVEHKAGKNGPPVAKPLRGLCEGQLAAPGQSLVLCDEGRIAWILAAPPTTFAQLTPIADVMGWKVTPTVPPHAGKLFASKGNLAHALERVTANHGVETSWDASRDPRKYDRREHIEPAVTAARDVAESCTCGSTIQHGASDSEEVRAARRRAHGWNGSFCSVTCALRSGPIHQRQPDIIEKPVWPWPPAAKPLPAQPAPLRSDATKRKAR